MLQTRVPGATIEARHLSMIQELCEHYDNGTFHTGTRQTLDVPGIKYENIGVVNKFLKGYIHDVDVGICDMDMEVSDHGYSTVGARDVMSCIGNAHCVKGNTNTYELVREIEKIIFPSHYHIKVAVAGYPNDCVEVNLSDSGIMGANKQDYDIDRCISYGFCVGAYKHHATGVLSLNRNGKVDKSAYYCVGCGECSLICPTGAWIRGTRKLYRVILGDRAGEQNPGTGRLFLNWVIEDVILGMFPSQQKFPAWALDYRPEYLHGGHLIDRVSYKEFVKHIFEGAEFNLEVKMVGDIFQAENEQRDSMHVMLFSGYKHVGPQEEK